MILRLRLDIISWCLNQFCTKIRLCLCVRLHYKTVQYNSWLFFRMKISNSHFNYYKDSFKSKESSLLLLLSLLNSWDWIMSVLLGSRIQGWDWMASSCILSAGLILRQDLTRSLHSSLMFFLNTSSALHIWSSFSNGMSPQTMSNKRMPRDQTVNGLALYRWIWIHSGGA